MKNEFIVDREARDETMPTTNVKVELHRSLDQLLEHMREGKAGGGMVLECHAEDGTTVELRLTLCNWTNQTECLACHGTGAEKAVMAPIKSNGQIH